MPEEHGAGKPGKGLANGKLAFDGVILLCHFHVLRRHGLNAFGGHLAHLAATGTVSHPFRQNNFLFGASFRETRINAGEDF